MKPLSLRLKGSKGIKSGLGLDEIFIDFTVFKPGIIAIQGTNGSGKSTILKNLHPFLMVIGSKSKIQEHFFLRDSEKEFICEQDGIKYRSHILIDAKSEKAEAYLYKGEETEPMNNGLLRSYEEAVEKAFGNPEIFMNVLHSSRKLIPITQMLPAKRKEIFYYYLGSKLTIFEEYDKIAKARQDEAVKSLDEKRTKISYINEQIEKLPSKETIENQSTTYTAQQNILIQEAQGIQIKLQEIEKKLLEENHKLSLVEATEKKVKEFEGKKFIVERNIEVLKKEHSELETSLQSKQSESLKEVTRLEKIIANKALIEKSIEEIKSIENELNAIIPKAKADKAIIQNQISELNLAYQQKKNEYDANVSRVKTFYQEKLNALEKEFSEKEKEYQRQVTVNIQVESDIQKRYTRLINEEEKQFAIISTNYAGQQRDINVLEIEEKGIISEIQNNLDSYDSLFESLQTQLTEATKQAVLIDKVPCKDTPEFVNTCELLINARSNKSKIETIGKEVFAKKESFLKSDSELNLKLTNKKEEIKTAQAKLIEPDRKATDEAIKNLEQQRNNELSEILQPVEPDKHEFLNEIEVKIELPQDKEINALKQPEQPDTLEERLQITSLEETIGQEESKRQRLSKLRSEKWQDTKKELDQAETILPEKKKAAAEILVQITAENERFTKTKIELNNNLAEINTEIEKLKEDANKNEITERITTYEQERESKTKLIEQNTQEQANINEKLLTLKQTIESKTNLEKDLAEQIKSQSDIERKVERLAFIREGLSKNGIPALIIHNVGLEVGEIANEFLRNGDSGLRVNFDTLKATKNGYKESFEIGINRNGSDVAVEDLSDGETCWIDESINKAIGIFLTSSKYSSHKYQSEFSDEKDGSLAPENKDIYLKLMQESLSKSGRDYLFFVTHSESIWKQIHQRIHLYKDGRIQIVN